jgi:hypothetical protein
MAFLDAFADWDRKTVTVNTPTYTRPGGIRTVSWSSSDLSVFCFQTSQNQKYLDSNISDEADYTIVCESSYSIPKASVVSFDSRYFEVLTPNNVLFQSEIQTIGMREVKNKPNGL